MKITVYKNNQTRSKIEQTKVKRDWMDDTLDAHAYKCFPVSMANTIGWSISFLDDIEFIWDGISDTTPYLVSSSRCLYNKNGKCHYKFLFWILF